MTTTTQYLWKHTDTSKGPNACWNWTGPLRKNNPHAYTSTKGGKRARTLIYQHYTGKTPPKGSALKPRCGNNLCVNPAHLSTTPNNTNNPTQPTRRQQLTLQLLQQPPADTRQQAAHTIIETHLKQWGYWYEDLDRDRLTEPDEDYNSMV